MSSLDQEMDRVHRVAADLPGIERSVWYGTPALKVAGKGFVRMKERGVLVVTCPLELKDILMEAEPGILFQTDHYRGWPAMLVRLDRIDDERLRERLECAWREKAPSRLLREYGRD
ncbi:MmcQ/YjbR family DNA-binding protein [Sphingosinicella rhizophila]|uniref:MmcQ/YjbR family DNA-binding protein n=1 Tax=Sphingosinicella rhizophila TaxID=3050082 RepID=A0ABU3Q504_9SPHN|nr:MmcQ/YjbR family DNA-binding protein [Sphingosinicella sp. GR2756]MDT9598144.1 MmcQ/YjbR family DNA-binding protein [Sphingosinicella sp. GR2756]